MLYVRRHPGVVFFLHLEPYVIMHMPVSALKADLTSTEIPFLSLHIQSVIKMTATTFFGPPPHLPYYLCLQYFR